MKIRPHQLNNRLEFGKIIEVTNPNTGFPVKAFKAEFSLWGAFRTRTLNQLFAANQAGLQDTRTIAVRHNTKLNDELRVRINSDIYRIVNISPDDTNGFLAFDFITVEKIDGLKGG